MVLYKSKKYCTSLKKSCYLPQSKQRLARYGYAPFPSAKVFGSIPVRATLIPSGVTHKYYERRKRQWQEHQ